MEPARRCPIWPTGTILPSPAVTSRPPGAKILPRDPPVAPWIASLRVILAILIVASCEIRKYCPVICPSVSATSSPDLHVHGRPALLLAATAPIRLVMYHARIVI